jgi:hypothetical protein
LLRAIEVPVKVIAPVVVTAAVCVTVPAVAVAEREFVVTAPWSKMLPVPVALRVKLNAPLIVALELNVMEAEPLVVMIELPVNVTGAPKLKLPPDPDVVMFPATE